jgi:hypothetical protein
VGISGFFIDLAVSDPERPGRYLLGIECDGVSYRRARSARDRDRLRRSVLEDQGWIIHRIWSTDWFQRPTEQLELTVAAIESAKAELDLRGEMGGRRRAVPVEVVAIEREHLTEVALQIKSEEKSGARYVEANPVRPPGGNELLATAPYALAQMVEHIVAVEGPVHIDEVIARIRSAWELQRSGVRIHSLVNGAVVHAVKTGRIQAEGAFLNIAGRRIQLRDRSAVASANLRKPEMLPVQEVRDGIIDVVRENFGATREQIVSTVLRLLGFKSTSSQLREVVQSAIEELTGLGTLAIQGELLVINELHVQSAQVYSS